MEGDIQAGDGRAADGGAADGRAADGQAADDGQAASLAQRRAAMGAALAGVRGIGGVLWQAQGADLGQILGEVDALGQACDAARVAVVGEAIERGETGTGPRAATVAQWVLAWAPSLRGGGVSVVVSLAREFAKAVNAPVVAAVECGRIPVRSAAVVVDELDKLGPLLVEGAREHVVEGLIAVAEMDGPRGCRRLRPALLARYGLAGQLQGEQDGARRFVSLSQPRERGAGIFEYALRLGTEGMTVLEAALGPLSAPRPVEGAPDLRGSDRRRGDALVELVRRAVAAGDSVPTTTKAQVFVTVDYDLLVSRMGGVHRSGHERDNEAKNDDQPKRHDQPQHDAEALRDYEAPGDDEAPHDAEPQPDHHDDAAHRAEDAPGGHEAHRGGVAAGTVVGGTQAGTLLGPETVRRIACDATLIPVVLGSEGEVLDWGRARRLFTPAQTKRLWLRDGGCTFPGCSVPASWTDGHHLVHWCDGGPTDLPNAALLCGHHHTVVHTRRLAGTITDDGGGHRVDWDLQRGSYDALLAQRASRERA